VRRPSGSEGRTRREPPRLRLPHRVSHSGASSSVRMQSVQDLDPPLIVRPWRSRRVDHQIFNLEGVLNPFIHAPVGQNTFPVF
jgi:hypothetical protein